MPISPANRALYPPDWPAISAAIRERDGNRCHWCGKPNGETILCRRVFLNRWKSLLLNQWWDIQSGWRDERGNPTTAPFEVSHESVRKVRVVLTVAHLDHNPENCAEENLSALCQACHLAHDRKQHAANARRTRQAKNGQLRLFQEGNEPQPKPEEEEKEDQSDEDPPPGYGEEQDERDDGEISLP